MKHRKIAICHPALKKGGGSEARPLWMAEALKKDYDVTLVTMGSLDLDKFNHAYGTHLTRKEITLVELPVPVLFGNQFDALRSYRLARFCKEQSSNYDLMISTYNVMDFGRRGIQFIADFSFDDNLRRSFDFSPDGAKGLLYKNSLLRTLYLAFGRVLSGTYKGKNGWKDNLTIANSDWSGRIMKEAYRIDSKTVYPPVIGDFPIIPWQEREYGFVCLGRLVPEKKTDELIRILSEVRKKGHDVHLHIIGKIDGSDYVKSLQSLAREESNWVFMEGGMFGKEKTEFLAKHKFGIHGRRKEAFGIAVAEMVKAGCIPFVPNDGGQTEIVDHPALLYSNIEDAAEKIAKVLRNEAMQMELRQHLALQAKKFSADNFIEEIRHLVQSWFNEYGGEGNA
jgi:glycosyltransferase involved in cell wall biosynthesis